MPKPLEVIGSDITGPVSPADINGNKYTQLFVDQAAGYCTGAALKKKVASGYRNQKRNLVHPETRQRHRGMFPHGQRQGRNKQRYKKIFKQQGTAQYQTAPHGS